MPPRVYKHRLSGAVIKLTVRQFKPGVLLMLCHDESRIEVGRCKFKFEATTKSLIILDVMAEPAGRGLGSLLLFEVITSARQFRDFNYVVADTVFKDSRRFFFQHGFLPARDWMKRFNNWAPPPEEGNCFALNYFRARKEGPDATIYHTRNGRSVTPEIFHLRIERGRNTPDWEMRPDALLIRAREKSRDWDLVS